MSVYRINTDGGARGNPGPAAIGAVIRDNEGNLVAKISQTVGSTTNNVAEYLAAIGALKLLYSLPKPARAEFFLDSALVVNQITGKWKIKQAHLLSLAVQARTLIAGLKIPVVFTAVPREKNQEADHQVNLALNRC